MISNKCAGCLALEGQFHHWPCDNEKCPFCGGQAIYCDCLNDMMDLILKRAEADTIDRFTAAEKRRWVNLIGDLKDKWQQVLSSPYDIFDMLDETPPDWCTTQEQLQYFEEISKICKEADIALDYKWEEFCAEKGRVPYLDIPQNWPS